MKKYIFKDTYLCSMHEIQWHIKFSQGTVPSNFEICVCLKFSFSTKDTLYSFKIENIIVMTYLIEAMSPR